MLPLGAHGFGLLVQHIVSGLVRLGSNRALGCLLWWWMGGGPALFTGLCFAGLGNQTPQASHHLGKGLLIIPLFRGQPFDDSERRPPFRLPDPFSHDSSELFADSFEFRVELLSFSRSDLLP